MVELWVVRWKKHAFLSQGKHPACLTEPRRSRVKVSATDCKATQQFIWNIFRMGQQAGSGDVNGISSPPQLLQSILWKFHPCIQSILILSPPPIPPDMPFPLHLPPDFTFFFYMLNCMQVFQVYESSSHCRVLSWGIRTLPMATIVKQEMIHHVFIWCLFSCHGNEHWNSDSSFKTWRDIE